MDNISVEYNLSEKDLDRLVGKPITRSIAISDDKDRIKKIIKEPKIYKSRLPYTCEICGKTVKERANKWNHEKTQYHKGFAKMNRRLRKLLLNDYDKVKKEIRGSDEGEEEIDSESDKD